MGYRHIPTVIQGKHIVSQIGSDMVVSGGTRSMTVGDIITFADDLRNSLAPRGQVVEVMRNPDENTANRMDVQWKTERKATDEEDS